jgi:RNA polymerase sigma-70 factor (ECF subfamily)
MTDSRVESNGDGSTSSTLLAAIRARDQEAWRRLVCVYGPLVVRKCRQKGLQEADVEDVVGGVFAEVVARIAGYQPRHARGSFRAWLRTITATKIIDVWRRRQAPGGQGAGGGTQQGLEEADLPDLNDPPDPSEEESERLIVFRRVLNLVLERCSETTRKAFVSVAIDERAPEDVAAEMGVTVNVVYLARSRVLQRVRTALDELEGM